MGKTEEPSGHGQKNEKNNRIKMCKLIDTDCVIFWWVFSPQTEPFVNLVWSSILNTTVAKHKRYTVMMLGILGELSSHKPMGRK